MLTCRRKSISAHVLVAMIMTVCARRKVSAARSCVRSVELPPLSHFNIQSSHFLKSTRHDFVRCSVHHRQAHSLMNFPSAVQKHVSLFLSIATRPILQFPSSLPGFPTHPSQQTLSMAHISVSGRSLTILTVFRSSKGGEVCRRVAGRDGALNRSGVVISRRPNFECHAKPHKFPTLVLVLLCSCLRTSICHV